MAEQLALGFGDLVRQLRAEAGLTQEELAEAAGLSPRSVSDLERGIHRTARRDTAELLAGALGLAGPARLLFVAAARGRAPAEEVLAALRDAAAPEGQLGGATRSPYRGLKAFEERDAAFFFGRDTAIAQVLGRMSRLVAGAGLLVVSGVSGAGKSSLLRAGVLPHIRGAGLAAAPGSQAWPRVLFTPTQTPLDELALRVGALAGADAAAVRRELEDAPAWFALTARQAALAGPPGRRMCRTLPVQIDELGDLPIRGLVISQRVQAHGRCLLQLFVSRHRHADRTDGSVSPEYGRIPALRSTRPRGGGQNSPVGQVPLQ